MAASQFSSLTWLPWKTTRPLYFRDGSSIESSEFFSTQISKMRPTCCFRLSARASALTSDQGRTPFSSQQPILRNRLHSFSSAAIALTFAFRSTVPTLRATQQLNKGGKRGTCSLWRSTVSGENIAPTGMRGKT